MRRDAHTVRLFDVSCLQRSFMMHLTAQVTTPDENNLISGLVPHFTPNISGRKSHLGDIINAISYPGLKESPRTSPPLIGQSGQRKSRRNQFNVLSMSLRESGSDFEESSKLGLKKRVSKCSLILATRSFPKHPLTA
ncbi:hypothetical protein WN51_02120 [Melipona quadrifasciata]|uniref:Uncharacterized protein n=1 Tax=Melipona quadrifasciata TaxID=166423 RepID=A0A0M8ZV88_9HYME|nr:hypothetical protein WN51_02120 [Melipona quadrifasciata]